MTDTEKRCDECTNWEMYCSCDAEVKALRARVKELEGQIVDAEASAYNKVSKYIYEQANKVLANNQPGDQAAAAFGHLVSRYIKHWAEARGKEEGR